jgi:hypothetical protein
VVVAMRTLACSIKATTSTLLVLLGIIREVGEVRKASYRTIVSIRIDILSEGARFAKFDRPRTEP